MKKQKFNFKTFMAQEKAFYNDLTNASVETYLRGALTRTCKPIWDLRYLMCNDEFREKYSNLVKTITGEDNFFTLLTIDYESVQKYKRLKKDINGIYITPLSDIEKYNIWEYDGIFKVMIYSSKFEGKDTQPIKDLFLNNLYNCDVEIIPEDNLTSYPKKDYVYITGNLFRTHTWQYLAVHHKLKPTQKRIKSFTKI